MKVSRRWWLRSAASWVGGAAATGAWGAALARTEARFPQRPITLWVPWTAGGATDHTMRLIAELAGQHLGQKVVVENRGGAGGTLVMPVLQQAAPDGYTLAQMPQPVFRAPWVQKVTWDPIRDTTPILQVSGVTFGALVVAQLVPTESFVGQAMAEGAKAAKASFRRQRAAEVARQAEEASAMPA